MSDALASLPTGTYPLVLGATAKHALAGGEGGDIVSMRYSFKPASVTQRTPGALEQGPSGRVVSFDTSNGYQVFDIREETAKSRECVLVWDGERECYVLHALPTTWHLTQNRTLSAQRAEGPFARPASPPKAVPAKRKPPAAAPAGALPSAATVDVPKRAKKAPAKKKAPAAPKPAPAPKPAAKPAAPKKAPAKKAAPKGAAAKKAAAAKAKGPPPSKVKSAEYIEDSDEDMEPTSEAYGGEEDGGDDGMDEFADLLGKAMEEDEDEEEEFEEDDEDELGGAQLGGGGYANDDVEYI